MKASLLTLCLLLLLTGVKAQCPPGSIELIKKRQRDWVADYNKLEKQYGPQVTGLKRYFYENGQAKLCIDLTELQQLAVDVKKALKTAKGPVAVRFVEAVQGIARVNPPASKSGKYATKLPLKTNVANVSDAPLERDSSLIRKTQSQALPDTAIYTRQIDQLTALNTALEKQVVLYQRLSFLFSVLALGTLGIVLWLLILKKRFNKSISRRQPGDSASERIDPNTNLSGNDSDARLKQFKDEVATLRNKNTFLIQKLADQHPVAENRQHPPRSNEPDPASLNQQIVRNQLDAPADDADKQVTDMVPAGLATITRRTEAPVPPAQFFLSTPTSNSDGMGTFSDKRQTQFDPIKSVYRFEITNHEETQATFAFESSAGAVSGALDYPETYLQPACEYTSFDSRASRIVTEKKGVAVKEGDKWRVTQKAQIRFA